MEVEKDVIRVASRKSQLALIQAKHVISKLKENFPDKIFEIHTMSTVGDRVLNKSLPKIGEKSLFTRDLEDSLRNGGVDLIVHSLKDLPTELPDGLTIGCVLERDDPQDVVVLRKDCPYNHIEDLPQGSVIGTSSLRRAAQLRKLYKTLVVKDIRGNLNTRLAKLDAPDSEYTGIVLAKAGLDRMGWQDRISHILEMQTFQYAVGQGALAVECRIDDAEVLAMCRTLVCLETTCCVLAERSFLKSIGGGCSAPIGVSCTLTTVGPNRHHINLSASVFSLDGQRCVNKSMCCSMAMDLQKELEKKKQEEEVNEPTKSENDNIIVINEDENTEKLAENIDMKELLGKHMKILEPAENATKCLKDCPLPIEIGQDFMGECPFVLGDLKTATSACPFSGKKQNEKIDENSNNNDVVDKSVKTVSPLTFTKDQQTNLKIIDPKAEGDSAKNDDQAGTSRVTQCPFRKRHLSSNEDIEAKGDGLQVFDYADEQKPLPSKRAKMLRDNWEAIYISHFKLCSLFGHADFDIAALENCHSYGIEMARDLIGDGAIPLIRSAQATIHNSTIKKE